MSSELAKELHKESGWYHKNVDKRGGILEIRKKFLDEAKEAAEDKSPSAAAVIGWNAHCDYSEIHDRYSQSSRLWSERNPPVKY